MNVKEILSLQFGHYSNFIGTHWWNIQEHGFDYTGQSVPEISHDVLFREGLTNKNEVTYTPRLLLVDLKGSLKTLPEHGELYEPISEPAVSSLLWPDDKVEVINEEKIARNQLQQSFDLSNDRNVKNDQLQTLDADVKVWSDFLYSRFHPQTIQVIKEYQHNNEKVAFDVYPMGTNLWHRSDFGDEFADKIRKYIEECDFLQGFHVTVDVVNAFGGLAASCLEHIKDEYDKKAVLTFAAIPSYYSDYGFTNAEQREESTRKDSFRLINLALGLEALSEHSDLTVPLCLGSKGWRQPGPLRNFNHINYNAELPFHSSAILASALDTLTVPYRLKSSPFTLGDFCSSLNGHNCKIAAASTSLPFPIRSNEDLIDCLDRWQGPLWQCLTPNCVIGTDKLMQLVTVRGISENRLKKPLERAKKQREMAAYRCQSVGEMVDFYLSCNSYATASHVTTLYKPLPVKITYPNIFDQFIGTNGDTLDFPRNSNEGVESVPIISGCHSGYGSGIGNMLETLHREATRMKINRFHQFKEAGLESDDYNESLNKLLDIKECYEE